MTLTLHMHPLSSFCQKVLIALYENGTPFEKHFLDLADPLRALHVRLMDRFFALYVMQSMQKIVLDNLRPEGAHDPHGVKEARAVLGTALDLFERDMAAQPWAAGEDFTLADCAAAPALFFVGKILPLARNHPNIVRYFERLCARPSYARALEESEPYLSNFPGRAEE